jgi:glutamine phosphoribosylpyrophosphate amidotransferase
MASLVENIRNSAPKSVHLRIAAPPITRPCQCGIDIPTYQELKANSFIKYGVLDNWAMATSLQVNTIKYLSMQQVRAAILNCNGNMFCDECVIMGAR